MCAQTTHKIEELIKELCPNGVRFAQLDDIADIRTGEFVHKDKQNPDGKYPVYNGGTTYTGFYNEWNREGNQIIISARGNAGFVNRVFTKFWSGNSCYTITIDPEKANWNYVYYVVKQQEHELQNVQQKGGIPAVSKKQVAQLKIPLPPPPVPPEVLPLLDSFSRITAGATAGLRAELTARKKQYAYYRDALLTFGESIKHVPLSQIAEIGTGSSNTNEGLNSGRYPFFVRSQEVRYKNTYEYDETAIITSGDGVGVGKIFHYVEGKYALHQRAYRIHIEDTGIVPKYIFYYMKSKFLPYIQKSSFHSSVTSIRRPMLNNFPIPLLPLERQRELVNTLDNFDAFCNDLTSGLPAEIAARQKQYEYYRDKLLTFKEFGA